MAEEDHDTTGVGHPGDVVAGKYRLGKQLGAGGMGFVVEAMHLELEQRVAIKFLYPKALANLEAVTRFSREARAAAKIRSEHAVKVIDVGRLEDGVPYMVMEHLDGKDLAQLVEDEGPLAVTTAVDYMLQACEALAEAHAMQIVHRDLKSANLFLSMGPDGEPSVKVLDFGVSKMPVLEGVDGPALTKTQTLMGSPAYMSPEQMMSAKHVDARSDIWGIGCILYELLTASLPFLGESMMELCSSILNQPTPSIAVQRKGLPKGLVAIVEKCLAKMPADRYQNVGELATALAPFGSDRAELSARRVMRVIVPSKPSGESAPASVSNSATSSAGASASMSARTPPVRTLAPWDTSGPNARSKLGMLAVGAALAIVIFGGGIALFIMRDRNQRLEAPTASAHDRATATTAQTAGPRAESKPAVAFEASNAPSTAAPPGLSSAATGEPTAEPVASGAPSPSAGASFPAKSPAVPRATPPPKKKGEDLFETRY